jgi:hypothetical protein
VISSLFKQILARHNFELQEIADLMNISVDRAKSLSTGRVKKFKPEEMQVLVDKLGIDSYWLMTGDGSMFGKKPSDSDELSVDEQMLLSAYREMTASEKKQFLKLAVSENKSLGQKQTIQAEKVGQQFGDYAKVSDFRMEF